MLDTKQTRAPCTWRCFNYLPTYLISEKAVVLLRIKAMKSQNQDSNIMCWRDGSVMSALVLAELILLPSTQVGAHNDP